MFEFLHRHLYSCNNVYTVLMIINEKCSFFDNDSHTTEFSVSVEAARRAMFDAV